MLSYVHKINFMAAFFKEAEKPLLFKDCTNGSEKVKCKIDQKRTELFSNKKVFSIRLVPYYTELQFAGLKYVKIRQSNWSHAISLNGFGSIDEYLKSRFNPTSRKVLRRNIRRLENSFNIRYQLFHGSITDSEYHFLMNSLRNMIEIRFREKNEVSKDLKGWELLQKGTLAMIRDKTASLFVIYNEQDPIEISLNYHFGDILFSSVSSFDTDYSKFGLGHTEIYKQLEWCIKNGYTLFDMGVGGMEYKQKWSNEIRPFSHYIFFKNGFPSYIPGYLEVFRVRLKEFLKSRNINDLVYSFFELFNKSDKAKPAMRTYNLQKHHMNSIEELKASTLREVDLEDCAFLKRGVYEYLYLAQEHISDISIFEITPGSQFLIQGKQGAYNLYFDSVAN